MATAQILVRPTSFAAPRDLRALYLLAAGLAMASGSIVLHEPAPYDIALVLLLFAGIFLQTLSFHSSQRGGVLLLAAFVAANFLPMPNAIEWRVAFEYSTISFYLAASWLFFVGVTGKYGYAGVVVLMRGYVFAGVLSAVLATLAYLRLIPYQGVLLRYGRAQGLFKDPNVYGPYLIPVLLYMLVKLRRERFASRRFWSALAICLTCTVGIFLSYSRACWIDCTVAVLCFAGLELLNCVRMRRVDRGLVRIGAVIALVTATTVMLIEGQPEVRTMLIERLGNHGLQDYDAVRFDTQHKALETFLSNPIGIGTRQSEFAFNYSTHNMYLRVLVENGVLGFAAFFAFVGVSLVRSTQLAITISDVRWRNLFTVLSCSLTGLLVNGCVIDTIRWRHLWFLLGLAWSIPATRRQTVLEICRLSKAA